MSVQGAFASRVFRNFFKRGFRFTLLHFVFISCILIILLARPRVSYNDDALTLRLERTNFSFLQRHGYKSLSHPRRTRPRRDPMDDSQISENTAASAIHVSDDSRRSSSASEEKSASDTEGTDSQDEDAPPALLAAPFKTPRKLHNGLKAELPVPEECSQWRSIARDTKRLQLYKKHFISLDFTDWFMFVSMFTEAWHAARHTRRVRPVYVDVAANHARRWSNTYFLDRCLGWNGLCAEANPGYHAELRAERHCALIDTCVSDAPRVVNFSFTAAYGGVVRDAANGAWGVDGAQHATKRKFSGHFRGFRALKCTTLARELRKNHVKHVDFMSLDVEGYELPVLQGIDWEQTIIDVIVVENKRKPIAELLTEKGYQRYNGVLKDDIYIRQGSGYTVNDKFAGWLKYMSKKDNRFHTDAIRRHHLL